MMFVFFFFFLVEEQAFKYFESAVVMDMCEEMELPYLNIKTYYWDYWDFQTFESVLSSFCAFAALKCC